MGLSLAHRLWRFLKLSLMPTMRLLSFWSLWTALVRYLLPTASALALIWRFTRLKEMGLKRIALLFSRNSKASATYQMSLSAFEQVYGTEPALSVGHVDSPYEVSEG